ncbi:3-dehydroquinate synthase II family protein [Nocardia sp. NPDC051030]|uniref:3-dehydroquinate synthase II family protein n=1 Tax=Nocardia sp. NPDC051030 TaxID=3155162 RepID=UPI003438E061
MRTVWIDLSHLATDVACAIAKDEIFNSVEVVITDDEHVTALLSDRTTVVRSARETNTDRSRQRLVAVDTANGLSQEADGAHLTVPDVHVIDDPTLQLACHYAREWPATVVRFQDPTKIPLEIVIAAADGADGRIICGVGDHTDAQVTLSVLEKGPAGILAAPSSVEEVRGLIETVNAFSGDLDLSEITVTGIRHTGVGERVCVDTCTQFDTDEGLLIGSFAHGLFLCVSETHPLPYMPTRPFRVNAGALHSYVLGVGGRTRYLSELRAGDLVLAVGADGRTREVVVGRAKIETRPLLTIDGVDADGAAVSLTVQDDWHVRVLGPRAAVLNVTELRSGDKILGFQSSASRHVGWPVEEFCVEV